VEWLVIRILREELEVHARAQKWIDRVGEARALEPGAHTHQLALAFPAATTRPASPGNFRPGCRRASTAARGDRLAERTSFNGVTDLC